MFGHGVKWPASAVLLLGLSQATTGRCQQGPAPLDCSGSKPSDGIVYQSGQHSYTIVCSLDYAGNDIASGNTATFEECIALCDNTPGCIDVSYGKPGCWTKSKLSTPVTRDGVWTARRADLSPPVSCEEPGANGTIYTTSEGTQFKILCGKDYAGADMGVVHSDTFSGCMDACEKAVGCVDVSYVGGTCYLKNALNALNDAGHVWSGVRVDALSPPSSSTAATDPSGTSTAGGSATSLAALSCVNSASDGLQHVTPSGTTYDIVCGQEYTGGDLKGVGADTFEACLAACDAESACVDVSYVPGACYMKQTLNGALVHAGHVWTAIKKTSTGGNDPTPDPAIPDLACVDGQPTHALFTTSKNRQYQVFCGVDFVGGDMSTLTTPTFTACIKACEDATGCVTVGYTGNTCYLKNRLRPRVDRAHVWSAMYLGPPPPPESSTAASSTQAASATESGTVAPSGSTSTQGDSGPIPTNGVWVPEFDDSWMATYTWTEVTLPTFADPAPTPISFPPIEEHCLIEPEAGTEFHLISPDMGYIIEKDNAPGFLSQPETEEEGLALLETIADWKPPAFVFETPAGAAQGMYDIAYMSTAGKRYFSVAASGELSLVAALTAATAVFGVSCDGYLTVTVGGTRRGLKATAEGKTVVDGTGESSQDGIRVLPKDLVPVNPNSMEAASQPASRLRRRAWDGMGQDGYAPRCPNKPRTAWPRVKAGARGYNPNGCGPANGVDFVPDWNFGGCCNDHDNCFDDCADKTFERCNLEFWGCMTMACVRDLNRWYNSWLQPACIGMGTFYFGAVSSPKGKKAFEEATDQRCECYCREANKALCNNDCINVFSNPDHCGGCDRRCPAGTHCSGLGCACDKHQCGNTCLDLANHPRNCGTCGNVCPSGFCYQGKCAELPANPDRCYPREAFENGDFQRGNGDMWRVGASSAEVAGRMHLGVFDGAASPDNRGMVVDFPPTGDHTASISQDVHLCAGQNYEFNFNARRVYGDGSCQTHVQLGSRVLQSWTPLAVTGVNWSRRGPFRMTPFELNQSGVWQGPRHYLKATMTVTVSCTGPRSQYSTVRMDGFSIAPV